jgi:hypothetical protein
MARGARRARTGQGGPPIKHPVPALRLLAGPRAVPASVLERLMPRSLANTAYGAHQRLRAGVGPSLSIDHSPTRPMAMLSPAELASGLTAPSLAGSQRPQLLCLPSLFAYSCYIAFQLIQYISSNTKDNFESSTVLHGTTAHCTSQITHILTSCS